VLSDASALAGDQQIDADVCIDGAGRAAINVGLFASSKGVFRQTPPPSTDVRRLNT
jgi:hypothetical protein